MLVMAKIFGRLPSCRQPAARTDATYHSKRIRRSRVDINIRVGGREHEDDRGGIDDVRKYFDTGNVDRDDKGRSVGVGGRLVGG